MREGWEIKKLGDCFESVRNGANIKQYDNAKGIPITRIETLSNDRFNRDRMGYADITDTEKYSSYVLNDGDILMSHINSVKYLGRAVQYKKCNDEIIIHGMNLLRLTPNSTIILSSYAEYYFKCYYFKDQIANITKKAVNQASFSITALNAVNVFVPPLSEQKRIVAELDLLSEVIAKKREQLTQLDALAQSLFYTMFGDPITNEKGWETKRLGEISTSQIGITYKPEDVSNNEKGTVVLRSGNIQNSTLCFKDIVRVNSDIRENKYVRTGDILMCSRNGSSQLVGKVAMIPNLKEKMTYGAFMTVIRSDFQPFLFAFFRSPAFRSQLTTAKTATINQITVKMLENMQVILPPLALQQQFAEKIEAIEQQKERIRQSLAEVQLLFDSRMDYYFNN